jgi:membrane protein required for colicin V production
LNWLDGVIVAVVLLFTFTAFQAGFIRETVTVVAAILGTVLAGLFYQELAEDALVFIDNETLAHIVGFVVIFGGTLLAGQMLALVLKPTTDTLQLNIFDQLAGAGFGFLKSLVIIQVMLILLVTYPRWDMDRTIDESVFGSLIIEDTAVLVKILPDEFEAQVDDFSSRFEVTTTR